MKRLKRRIAMIMAMATLFTVGFSPANISFASELESENNLEAETDVLEEDTSTATDVVTEETPTQTQTENAENTSDESEAAPDEATGTDAEEEPKEVIYGGPLPIGFEWVYEASEEYFQEDLHLTKQEYVDMLCGTNYAHPLEVEPAEVEADEYGISIVPRSYQLLTAGAANTMKYSDVKWWMEARALGVSYGTAGCNKSDSPASNYGWSCAGFVSSVIYRFYDTDIANLSNTAAVSNVDRFCSGSTHFSYVGGYSVSNGAAYYTLCSNGTIKPGDVLVFTRNGSYKHAAIAGDDTPSGIDRIDGVYYLYHALNSSVGTVVTTAGYYLSGASDKTGNYVKVYRAIDDVKGSVTLKKVVDNSDVYDNYDYSYVGCEYTIYNSSNTSVGTFTIQSDGRGKVTSSSYGGLNTYTLSELPAGSYTVSETKVTDDLSEGGIKINGTKTNSFTVSSSNKTITVEGTNNLNFDGTLKLTKTVSNGATNFDLSGAVYDVYHVDAILGMGDDNKTYVGSFVTDKDGIGHVTYNEFNDKSNADGVGDYNQTTMTKLPYGSYAIVETKAPTSGLFDISSSEHIITISVASPDKGVTDSEQFHPYKVKLKKSSANTVVVENNNCYSLKGATYTVYEDYDCSVVAIAYNEDGTTYNAELICDENGETNTLLMEKGTYYVKETVAGKGYALDKKVHTIELTDAHRDTPYELQVSDKPQMDPIYELLYKADKDEPDKYRIQGATFEVRFYAGEYDDGVDPATLGKDYTRKWLFKTDENGRVKFTDNEKYFITGDEFYRNSAGIIMLPLGTVTIQEKSTPVEYILDDTVHVRRITADGVVEEVTTYNEPVIPNKPKRQAFQIKKLGETSTSELNPLANAGFMAANVNDLEQDADGNYIWNESKAVLLCDINNTPDNFDDDVKELFTDSEGYAISAKLRYGTYLVHETTVPKNYKPIKDFTITIDKDSDMPQETRYFVDEIIKSYLRIIKVDEATKLPILSTDEGVRFKIFSYDDNKYLSFKTYIDGRFVNVSEFTINNDGYVMTPGVLVAGAYRLEEYSTLEDHYMRVPSGYYDFTIDKDTVFETYVDEDGNEADAPVFTIRMENSPYFGQLEVNKVGEFYELVDGEYEKQNVPMENIEFGIYAADDIYTNDNQNIIRYHKDELVYTIKTDVNGYAASRRDLPLGAYYLKELNCPEDYEPCEDVTFEVSTEGDIKTINNADGSVLKYISVSREIINYKRIELHTTATDKNTGLQSAFAGENATIVDEVLCKNLLIGHTYRVEGKLYDVDTGEAVLVDGKEVTAYKEFEATEGVMVVTLEYTLDATLLKGKKTVVFEELYEGDKLKASHCILEEKSQQIDFPEIHTTFLDEASGDHYTSSVEEVVLTDHVAYKGLVAGKTYTLAAVLMDKETEKPVMDGMLPVISTITFVPEASEGEASISFVVNGELLKGRTIVCFESVLYEDKLLAIHADIYDENQTIYSPEIKTEAKGSKYLGHVEMLDKEITIIDTVMFHNLDTSKSYTVCGQIYDQSTGEVLLDDEGNEIKQIVIFTPETSDGSIDIVFTFKALKLAGTTTVVFEDLYETETARKVASHADIADEGQQVYIDYTKLEISKQDATTSSEVEGAKLSLYNEDEELVDCWISTAEKHIVNELLPGRYRLVEETAPNGYIVSEEVTFVLEDKGELQKVVMYDEEVTGRLHIIKLDDYSKKKLAGVKFMLFKKSDSVITTGIDQYLIDAWNEMDEEEKNVINAHKKNIEDLYVGTYVTDENGEFTTDKLMYGEYYLIETEPKDGYILVSDACEFSIEIPEQELDMTIENRGKEGRIDINPNPSKPGNGDGHFPKTGDNTPVGAVVAIMLVASALCLFLRRRLKKVMAVDDKNDGIRSNHKDRKGKKLLSLAVAGVIGASVASTPTYAAEPKDSSEKPIEVVETKTGTYDTDDESTYDFGFEDEIEIDGIQYKLDGITYDKKEHSKFPDGIRESFTNKYEAVDEDFMPNENIMNSGIEYELDKYEVKPSEESELHLFYYDETDYQTSEPEHKESVEYTYHDEATGKDYEVTLPYSRTEAVDSCYAITVTFSGTVTGYDAAYIVIGDRKIENQGEILALTNDIICMLLEQAGANPADYTDYAVYYVGEPYSDADGNLCRDYEISTNAYGTKYRVYYEDDFKNLTTEYTCEATYKLTAENLEEFQIVSYEVTATATYTRLEEEEKGFLDTVVGKAVLSGAVVLGLAVIIALGIYIAKGGRKDTDYRSKRDSRRDYKNLNK